MRFVIQRVSSASCTVGGSVTGQIGQGFAVLVGISGEDTEETADKMAKKLLSLRIFEDAAGKTNLSLGDVGGGLLLIPQFTLYADCRRGNRPSFTKAGKPDMARKLFGYIVQKCGEQMPTVNQGVFGAHMEISLVNDGPFTVILDSAEILGS